MQYGLAAWGLREESLESQLRITSGLGLNLLEFSIANYEKDALQIGAAPEQIREVKEMFRKYGIRLECGCTGNDFTGDDVEDQIRKVTEVIDIAAELGIRFLRIFAGFQSDSVVCGKRKTRMLDALRTVQAHAERKQACPEGRVFIFRTWEKRHGYISGGGKSRNGCAQPSSFSSAGMQVQPCFLQRLRTR